MIFNILIVLLVTCFATITTPSNVFAVNNDVTIENASLVGDDSDDSAQGMPDGDVDNDDDDDDAELVSYDPAAREHTFNFDGDHDDDDDDRI